MMKSQSLCSSNETLNISIIRKKQLDQMPWSYWKITRQTTEFLEHSI